MTTRLSFVRFEFLRSWTFLVNKMSLWIGSDPFAEFESMRPLKKDVPSSKDCQSNCLEKTCLYWKSHSMSIKMHVRGNVQYACKLNHSSLDPRPSKCHPRLYRPLKFQANYYNIKLCNISSFLNLNSNEFIAIPKQPQSGDFLQFPQPTSKTNGFLSISVVFPPWTGAPGFSHLVASTSLLALKASPYHPNLEDHQNSLGCFQK